MKPERRIFEEVDHKDAARTKDTPTGAIDRRNAARKLVANWLLGLCALVILTIVVGGLTRLTDSGLSITEWRLVAGVLPPLSEAAWQAEFAKYQEIPEFQLQNQSMDLAAFKQIYWWEWTHRQLGRLIGLYWAAGFIWLAFAKRLPAGWTPRLLGVGALIGVQGAVGWWMVASGLSGSSVDVAPARLLVHLMLAFAILGFAAWFAMVLRTDQAALYRARRDRDRAMERLSIAVFALTLVQIALGALVAGTDAGSAFPTWPLMNGEFFPSGSFALEPTISNFVENPGLTQFNHRIAGYLLVALALVALWRSRSSPRPSARRAFERVAAVVLLQAAIGVGTVLYSAPVAFAAVHQAGAVVVFLLILRACFQCRFPRDSVLGVSQ